MSDDIIFKYTQALDKLERFKSVSNCAEMDLVYDLIRNPSKVDSQTVAIIASKQAIAISTISTILHLFDHLDPILHGRIRKYNGSSFSIKYLNCRVQGYPISSSPHSFRGSSIDEFFLVDFENFPADKINELDQHIQTHSVNNRRLKTRYGY